MNQIRVIFPYRHEQIWAFDDATVGLLREPFVLGIPELTWVREEYEGG